MICLVSWLFIRQEDIAAISAIPLQFNIKVEDESLAFLSTAVFLPMGDISLFIVIQFNHSYPHFLDQHSTSKSSCFILFSLLKYDTRSFKGL